MLEVEVVFAMDRDSLQCKENETKLLFFLFLE